jgi:hypothetical protein
MSAPSSEASDYPILTALVPGRLFAPGSAARTWRDVTIAGGEDIPQQAADWQKIAAQANWWEVHSVTAGTEQNRAFELAGLMASVGERLGLAYTAAVESELWRRTEATTREQRAAYDMGCRAMSELQAHYVISVAHGLINVTARALALHLGLRTRLQDMFRTVFRPFSEERADWIPCNPATAAKLATVAASLTDEAVTRLPIPVNTLVTGAAWISLEKHRGKDFHRWRPQSPHLARVAQRSPWTVQSDGSRSLSISIPVYQDHDDLAVTSARVATDGMRAVAEALAAFMEHWPHASPVLGGPRFREDAD